MSEIRNLTRNGETFYPLTTTSAVINEATGEGLIIDETPTAGSDNLVESGGVNDYHNNKIQLAQGNGTDWSKVIVGAYVSDWNIGTKRLYLDFVYRNDPTYGSGIRLRFCEADFSNMGQSAFYWTALAGEKNGIEVLTGGEYSYQGLSGKLTIVVNWEAIPNGFNKMINPVYFIDPIVIPSNVIKNAVDQEPLVKYIVQSLNSSQKQIAQENIGIFVNDKIYGTRANEEIFEEAGTYMQFGMSMYSYPVQDRFDFDEIVLRGVNLNAQNSCQYKVYAVNKGLITDVTKTIIRHTISPSTHRLLKEGELIKSTFDEYTINFDTPVTCLDTEFVMIYLVGTDRISLKSVEPVTSDYNSFVFSLSSTAEAWAETWYPGYNSYSLKLMKKSSFVTSDELHIEVAKDFIENIDGYIHNYCKIQIPDTIYAIVGTELNVYNDTISLSVDKGLQSPINYSVVWLCNVGLITERGWRFTPSDVDAGKTYTLNCKTYDNFHNLIATKNIIVKVKAKNALSSAKNIVYFGDSLGASAATKLWENFENSNKFTGTKPKMLGTIGDTNHYEAVGGYEWASYATQGETVYRASVSNITSLTIGTGYLDATGKAFYVREVNITSGSGNILLEKLYTHGEHGYGDLQIPSGTLTKLSGAGDDTVNYTGAFIESGNPLWNINEGCLDIAYYKQKLVDLGQLSSVNDKIDAVSFQFGINDRALASNLPQLMEYIDALYQLFINDNANCKFIIGLTTTAGNTVNGAGSNYGASWDTDLYPKQVYTIRDLYLTLQDNANYPNIRVAPINNEVDRYYGYGFGLRKISQRFESVTIFMDGHTETISDYEVYHNNAVHPASCGYGQIGDAYFAAYVGFLTE